MVTINQINDVPLHYARTVTHPYGTRGVQHKFQVQPAFLETLKNCFTEIIENNPLGKPEVVTCGGVFVDKPGSLHNRGRAFDLDAIFWKDYTLLADNFLFDYELYLGIESFLRKHCGIVLNYYYNTSHQDHWHIDDSMPPEFMGQSKSQILYIQLCLSYLYNQPVVIDGIWGPQTNGALNQVLHHLKIVGGFAQTENWQQFLDLTGKIAFRIFRKEKQPDRLLRDVQAILNRQRRTNNAKALEALNRFRNHTETQRWLNSFERENTLEEAIRFFVIAG